MALAPSPDQIIGLRDAASKLIVELALPRLQACPDSANVTLKHGEGLELQDLSFELRVIGKDRLLPGDDLKS